MPAGFSVSPHYAAKVEWGDRPPTRLPTLLSFVATHDLSQITCALLLGGFFVPNPALGLTQLDDFYPRLLNPSR